ncbi:MAG: dipeptidase [Firmicutes bacterium]|nr:dipeptidase [Bacillota bacterium]
MKVVDMHCDTVLGLLEEEEKGFPVNFLDNDLHIDLHKLQKGQYLLQNFALFTDQKKREIPEEETMKLMDMYYRMLEENEDIIAPVYTYEDIEKNEKEGKISALLTLEDGGVVFDSLAMLRNYYRMGVRMIALTWNYPNGIGYPNLSMDDFVNYKEASFLQRVDTVNVLTDFGLDYIQEMERLGMIIDVSHLNDAGFYDVLKYTTKPFVASHSNARALCPVARNLSDDMIIALAQRGGVMGINFCGDFLDLPNKEPHSPSRIQDMVAHIKYIRDLAGIDVIALGTDFDGINCKLEIENASQIQKLAVALEEEGFTQEEIEKIFYKNVLRVYKEVLK